MTSSVYVIKSDDGQCKIGSSKYPATRISHIRGKKRHNDLAFSFIGQCADAGTAVHLEYNTHAKLKASRVSGDWFSISAERAIEILKETAAELGFGVIDITLQKPNRRRPRSTGVSLMLRLQPDLLKILDDWRRKQKDLPSRSEAVRRLIAALK